MHQGFCQVGLPADRGHSLALEMLKSLGYSVTLYGSEKRRLFGTRHVLKRNSYVAVHIYVESLSLSQTRLRFDMMASEDLAPTIPNVLPHFISHFQAGVESLAHSCSPGAGKSLA